jgi:hypothetical protein
MGFCPGQDKRIESQIVAKNKTAKKFNRKVEEGRDHFIAFLPTFSTLRFVFS